MTLGLKSALLAALGLLMLAPAAQRDAEAQNLLSFGGGGNEPGDVAGAAA